MKVKYWQREPIGKSKKTAPRRLRGKPEPVIDTSKGPTFELDDYFTKFVGISIRDDIYSWDKGGAVRTSWTTNNQIREHLVVYHGANCSSTTWCDCRPSETTTVRPAGVTTVPGSTGDVTFSESYGRRYNLLEG